MLMLQMKHTLCHWTHRFGVATTSIVRMRFRESRQEVDAAKVQTLLQEATRNLDILKRQV
jgi:hypothetical protein